MHVKQHGTGSKPYFGLHGWSGDHRTFDPLIPFVPSGARLYSADLPGCGMSPPPARWDLDAVAREIAAEFDRVGSPVTLIGNCSGGLLGMRAAMIRPEAVCRIVLIDAFARWPWYFRVFTQPGWGKYVYASTFANPAGRWITNRALASKRSRQDNLTEGFVTFDHATALRYLEILGQIRSAADFAGISVPVDLISGSRTFRAARESAAVWQAMWPQARVWTLPDTGHLPLRESAPAMSEIIFNKNREN